jgi:hypothetical protein
MYNLKEILTEFFRSWAWELTLRVSYFGFLIWALCTGTINFINFITNSTTGLF